MQETPNDFELDIIEHFSLDFLGEKWKDCYIDFHAFSVGDVKKHFPQLSALDKDDQKQVMQSLDTMLSLIKDKFIGGKVVSKGKITDMPKEALDKLPTRVLTKMISFLFQGATQTSATQ